MTYPFIEINDAGISFLANKATPPKHPADKPTQVTLRRDLSLQIEGHGFSCSTALTEDQAFGLASMLLFGLRECQFK